MVLSPRNIGGFIVAQREIHNELDRKNRNNHNDNYTELYRLKKTVNGLVLDSGESDAEVVQARAGEETLNDRLENMEGATSDVSGDVSSLEDSVDDKLETMASLDDLDKYSQEVTDELEEKLKEVEETIDDVVGNIEFKGAMVKLTSNQSVDHREHKVISWDKSDYNLSGFWSSGDSSKFVIPEGVRKVRLQANVLWESAKDGDRMVQIRKNGDYSKGLAYVRQPAGSTSPLNITTGVVEVTEGDYFNLRVYQSSGDKINLREDPYTWFSIEVLDYRKK